MNPQKLTELAEAYSDAGLRKKFLDAVAEKELVHANQKVGGLVERLIRESIEKSLQKNVYKVDKVTIGSDVKIAVHEDKVDPSSDFLDEEGRELFVKISSEERQHLVEVKSARQDSVRMTIPQARQAHSASNAFTLCVVEVGSDILTLSDEQAKTTVMQNARFVFPIGEKLGGMVKEVDAFQSGEKALANQQGLDMQVDVISEAKIRIKVTQAVWQNGMDFNSFIQLLGRGIVRHPDASGHGPTS